jgi:hypothetical protein
MTGQEQCAIIKSGFRNGGFGKGFGKNFGKASENPAAAPDSGCIVYATQKQR